MSQKFRYDINGLRAYAVATVVLFHFGVFGFTGGFIGVDVFFVISGFLMTSIVIKGVENQKFSLLKFYLSRAIRIIPALLAVCLVMLILGWFFLLPLDYQALSKHIISSINFLSNITYYLESGYFDTSSHNKALLHTWSLSAEWQFYILFPIAVLLLHKINSSRKFLIISFFFATIISLITSIYLTNRSPSAGFFLLPARAWEMLAGGLVFFAASKTINSQKINFFAEVLGFGLIVLSVYFFSSNTIWPSYHALLPVLGTALILLANNQNSIFTQPKIFQFLGNTSYSIYLWHWPIVFFLYYNQKLDNIFLVVLGIFLSVILGYLSYKYIENPSRNYLTTKSLKLNYLIWILSIVGLSLVSYVIYKKNGIENRFESNINQVLSIVKDINPRRDECLTYPGEPLKQCKYGSGPTSLLVVGDSHANAMMGSIQNSLPATTSLVSWTISGCTAVEGLKKTNNTGYKCGELISEVLNKIKSYPSDLPLLIVNRTNSLFKGEPDNESISKPTRYISVVHDKYDDKYNEEMKNAYVETLCKFAKDRKVYITRPTPEAPFSIPEAYAKKLLLKNPQQEVNISFDDYMKRSQLSYEAQDLAQDKCGVKIIDISKAFCNKEKCEFIRDEKPIFVDDDHMKWHSAHILTPYFLRIFK